MSPSPPPKGKDGRPLEAGIGPHAWTLEEFAARAREQAGPDGELEDSAIAFHYRAYQHSVAAGGGLMGEVRPHNIAATLLSTRSHALDHVGVLVDTRFFRVRSRDDAYMTRRLTVGLLVMPNNRRSPSLSLSVPTALSAVTGRPQRPRGPVAVAGLAVRTAAAAGAASDLWALLRDGVDAVERVPITRWLPAAGAAAAPQFGTFLALADDALDHGVFGIAPREAATLDPHQRVALELAWAALDDAAVGGARGPAFGRGAGADDTAQNALADTGVFLGVSSPAGDFMQLASRAPAAVGPYSATSAGLGMAAGRVAFALGARGPALAVDTASSASLVAVHLAMQALAAGECDAALAGGVNLILAPHMHA